MDIILPLKWLSVFWRNLSYMGKTLKNGNRYEEKDLEEDFNKPDKLVFDKVGR